MNDSPSRWRRRLTDSILVSEAIPELLLCRLQARWAAKQLLRTTGQPVTDPPPPLTPDQQRRADEVVRAVQFAQKRLHLGGQCLARAICIKRLLDRRKIPAHVYFGVRRKDQNELAYHAWIQYGDRQVNRGTDELAVLSVLL